MRVSIPERRDWIASLVVLLVALPLSLGVALASGANPAAGLIAAVVGGVVVGALAGVPLAVTGPAAGLSAFVFQLVQEHGLQALALITVIAGLTQALLALLKSGKLFEKVPMPVLEGTLSAIGFIIVLGQLHVLMGQAVPSSPVTALLSLDRSMSRSIATEQGWIAPVLVCGLIALAVDLLWTRAMRGKTFIPGALPAVVIATLVSLNWTMPRVELAALIPLAQEQWTWFKDLGWTSMLPTCLGAGVALALVASAESLLTAKATGTLASKSGLKGEGDLNRELLAQGVGNLVSGALGGLPVTAVMVRSAANINSGAVSRWSTVLHGLWIALFVGLAPWLLSCIPLTALAAVLIVTGARLINLPHLRHTWRRQPMEGALWTFTALAIIATDLMKGMVLALIAAGLWHLFRKFADRSETNTEAA